MLDAHGLANTDNTCEFLLIRGGEIGTSTVGSGLPVNPRAKTCGVCRKFGLPVRGSNFSPTGTHRAVHASTGCAGAEGPRAAVRGQRAALVAAALPCNESLGAHPLRPNPEKS